MPSHTIHSALTQMFYDLPGAPWDSPVWQDVTGVRFSLFPPDDAHLPSGWSREMATDISSYFDKFRALKTEDQKIKFSSGKGQADTVPGRKIWRDWVTKGWKEWKIHSKIVDVLLAENLHPFTIAAQTGNVESWPDGHQWTPLAVDPVGTELFGEECWANGMARVRLELRPTIKALTQRTWITLYNSLNRSKVRIALLESEATKAFEGSYSITLSFYVLTLPPRFGP